MQILEDVAGASFSSPARFAVEIGDRTYKLFNYFPVGKDDDRALALHCYWASTHTLQKRLPKPLDKIPPDERFVSALEYDHEARAFIVNKVDFHDSGVITIKDSKGSRMSEDRDIQSIEFADIPDFIKLCHMYPASFSEYPEVDWREEKPYNLLALLDERAARIPVRIDLYLCRSESSSRLEGNLLSKWDEFAAFRDKATLRQAGLYVYSLFIKSDNPSFNSYPVTYIDVYQPLSQPASPCQ